MGGGCFFGGVSVMDRDVEIKLFSWGGRREQKRENSKNWAKPQTKLASGGRPT